MMPICTILSGVALVALGVWGYVKSEADNPATALIPVGFGIAFLFLGAMAFRQAVRKHVMHAAAGVALLGVIGGCIAMWISTQSRGKTFHDLGPQTQLLMTVTCLTLLGLCINSFVQARLARKREAAQAR